MRLCQYRTASGEIAVGARTPRGAVVGLAALDPRAVGPMSALIAQIAAGELDLAGLAERVINLTPRDEASFDAKPDSDVHFMAPVTEPPKFFAIAINGRENWERAIKPAEPKPQYFIKLRTCITGPKDPVEIPDIGAVGPEVELACVIGIGGRHISETQALDHVLGYTVHNDLTAHTLRSKSEWIRLRRKDGSEEHLTYPGRWEEL